MFTRYAEIAGFEESDIYSEEDSSELLKKVREMVGKGKRRYSQDVQSSPATAYAGQPPAGQGESPAPPQLLERVAAGLV